MISETIGRMVDYAGLAHQAYQLRQSEQIEIQERVRRHLSERMGRMRGLPQKLGQILSLDDPGGTATEEYTSLRDDASALPFETVLPIMEKQWNTSATSLFRSIDETAHAASLGQVHRGVLNDGREVAIKVQYPGVHQAVRMDLKMLGWLSLPVGNLRRGFDLQKYRQVILDDLDEELDYRLEAENQRAFATWASDSSNFCVPKVIDELSGEQVLVSQWIEGETWDEVRSSWPDNLRKVLARNMAKFFIEGLFLRGMMHADWHPGNIRFLRQDGQARILLYDFGCVFKPRSDEIIALARLIRASGRRDESPWPLFLKLGFDEEYLSPLAAKLPALCHVLFEPFCVEYPYRMDQWQLSERVGDILGDDRWNFRIAGPASLIFLMRAFHGLKYYLEKLEVELPWRPFIGPMLAQLEPQMNNLSLPDNLAAKPSFDSMAKYLKIRVRQDGRTRAELSSYASNIDNLDSLIDEDVKQRIVNKGLRLDKIVSDIRRRGYTPGPVFQLEDNGKQVDVWLE